MIRQDNFYVVECDECHEQGDSAGYGGSTVYDTLENAKDAERECGWKFVGEKSYCESCSGKLGIIDENDVDED